MTKLVPQPWMESGPTQRILRALGSPQVDVRFVGGCVRDAIVRPEAASADYIDMGVDIDIGTPDVPTRVVERLEAAGIKAIPTGIDHGTITAVVDGMLFEITTLRRDTACDGRHAVVEFSTDWHEDARRRDFTMNAISMRPDGMLFDDHGGVEDAKAGRLRFVGAAEDRIREDYLRILRLFRFFASYGRAPIESTTLEACRKYASHIPQLSAERIYGELYRTLAAPDPTPAVNLMIAFDVLPQVLPTAADPALLTSLVEIEDARPRVADFANSKTWDEKAQDPAFIALIRDMPRRATKYGRDALLRLAALLPHEHVKEAADRLKVSNDDRARLLALTDASPRLAYDMDRRALDAALYHFGGVTVIDRALLAWAAERVRGFNHDDGWRKLLETAEEWLVAPAAFPLRGGDVLALGVTPGPRVGELLRAVEDWWIAAGFKPLRDEALKKLKDLAQKNDGLAGE